MNKLTSNSAILREEVKTQVEFDLLVAVCRASGMPLADQRFDVNDYNSNYLTFIDSHQHITETCSITGANRELISFEDAIFSLAKPEWTHIWQGDISEEFVYGNNSHVYFNVSHNRAYYQPITKYYTLIAICKDAADEPPKLKFKVGDVVKHKNGMKKRIIFIDDKSVALENLCGGSRHFIQRNSFGNYEKVIPIRENLADVLRKSDFPLEAADAILEKFNVTEKANEI
jgi:hypothetical protein